MNTGFDPRTKSGRCEDCAVRLCVGAAYTLIPAARELAHLRDGYATMSRDVQQLTLTLAKVRALVDKLRAGEECSGEIVSALEGKS